MTIDPTTITSNEFRNLYIVTTQSGTKTSLCAVQLFLIAGETFILFQFINYEIVGSKDPFFLEIWCPFQPLSTLILYLR